MAKSFFFYILMRDYKFLNSSNIHARTCKAPAKRSQHVNATYCNIVGRNMLHAFGHHVAKCRDMLGVVGSSLKMVKFEPATPNMSNNVAICCDDMLQSFGRGLRPQ